MYVCMMDHGGTILSRRNVPAATEALADGLRPDLEDLALAVEFVFTWYWAADPGKARAGVGAVKAAPDYLFNPKLAALHINATRF
jgi:hypothetical protein